MSTPAAAQRFDHATRAANDLLVEMERAAFARVSAGDLPGAQAILNGPAYSEQKVRISAIVDGEFSLIADGISV